MSVLRDFFRKCRGRRKRNSSIYKCYSVTCMLLMENLCQNKYLFTSRPVEARRDLTWQTITDWAKRKMWMFCLVLELCSSRNNVCFLQERTSAPSSMISSPCLEMSPSKSSIRPAFTMAFVFWLISLAILTHSLNISASSGLSASLQACSSC